MMRQCRPGLKHRDVLRPRRAVQEHLRLGTERDLLSVKNDLADALAGGTAAGFARENDIDAALLKELREDLGLHGFARALTALERQEPPAGHR